MLSSTGHDLMDGGLLAVIRTKTKASTNAMGIITIGYSVAYEVLADLKPVPTR